MTLTFGEECQKRNKGYRIYPPHAVGIELELESNGNPFAMDFASNHEAYWHWHAEDSLRNGFELVFAKPTVVGSPEYNKCIELLGDYIEGQKNKLIISPRTSLHLHVNVQNYTIRQIYNIVLNIYLFENLLSYRCSANRKGNLFCMRGCDAEAALYLLADNIRRGYPSFQGCSIDHFKYGALNLAAIPQRGTVEFRFMDATLDSLEIDLWVKSLEYFVSKAAETDILVQLSKIKSDVFDIKKEAKELMGDYFSFLTSKIDFTSNMSEIMVMDNVLGIIHVMQALQKKTKKRKFPFTTDDEVFHGVDNLNPMMNVIDNGINITIDESYDDDYEESYEDDDIF